MADLSDEELVRRFLRGDRAAMGTLVERHQSRIHGLCLRMLGRREDAADATQDVFITCMRKLGGFREEARFSTWLYRVAVNVCHDTLRKRSRERPMDEDAPEGEAGGGDPASQAAAAADVERGLRQIPEDYRAVLLLHDLHDLPYEEVARVIGAPLGTVKSRIHRGRVALARALEGTPLEPAEGAAPSKQEETP